MLAVTVIKTILNDIPNSDQADVNGDGVGLLHSHKRWLTEWLLLAAFWAMCVMLLKTTMAYKILHATARKIRNPEQTDSDSKQIPLCDTGHRS